MRVSVTLDERSLNDTLKALNDFGKEAKKVIKDVVNRTALAVETDAAIKIKDDVHIDTARLRNSIHAEFKPMQTYAYSNWGRSQKNPNRDVPTQTFDGGLKMNFEELASIAGTNVDYAPKIEFEYDSFLRYAAEKQKQPFLKRMNTALNDLIKRKSKQ